MKKNNIVNLHTANKAPACPIYKIKSLFNKATHPALEAAKKHIHQVLESGKCPYIGKSMHMGGTKFATIHMEHQSLGLEDIYAYLKHMSHIIQDHSVMHHERNMTHVHVGFENIGTEKHEMTILLTHSYLYYRDEFIENGYAISSLGPNKKNTKTSLFTHFFNDDKKEIAKGDELFVTNEPMLMMRELVPQDLKFMQSPSAIQQFITLFPEVMHTNVTGSNKLTGIEKKISGKEYINLTLRHEIEISERIIPQIDAMSAEEIYYLLYSKVLSSHEAFQHIEYHETLAKIASLNATSKLQEILHEYIDSIKEYK